MDAVRADAPAWIVTSLELDRDRRVLLKRFHDEGLVWLVNTAILHPRGYALAIHYDDDDTLPLGLSVLGDGKEPWIFAPGEQEDVLARYEAAEADRERAWSPENLFTPDDPDE